MQFPYNYNDYHSPSQSIYISIYICTYLSIYTFHVNIQLHPRIYKYNYIHTHNINNKLIYLVTRLARAASDSPWARM